MTDKFERRKRLAILLWVFLISLLLWLTSFLPNKFDFGSYLNYLLILFGGGFAFHFLTEMISVPANEENWGQWGKLSMCLVKAAAIILSVFCVAYFERYVYPMGGAITFLSIFPAIWFSVSQAEKAHKILFSIKQS